MASQAKFIHENIDEVYCQKLVYWSFKGLFTMYLSEYIYDSTVRIGVVGSISNYFKEILEQVFLDCGMSAPYVIQKPIDGLVSFYLSNNENGSGFN